MSDIRTRFSIDIEKIRGNSPDVSYIEIITEYCEKEGIEVTLVPKLLTPTLKQKITREAKERNQINDITDHYTMDELI